MSGTMMPPGGAPPQMSPQMLQMLMMQRAQQQGGMGQGMPQQGMQPGMQGQGAPQLPPQVIQALLAQRAAQQQQQAQAMAQQGGGGAMAGLPPQVLQALMAQRAMQQRAMGGTPGAPAPQTGMPQQQAPFAGVGSAAAQNPNLQLFGRAAQSPVGGGGATPQQTRLTPAEMARLGRFGDQVIGHLTPGEIEVPPEVQSPKVLATLNQAFNKAGVHLQQFQAGSPQQSVNPNTGAPEFSLWSALLPIAGAVAGSFIPGLGTGVGAALGGAVGGAAGGIVDHTGLTNTLLQAAGGAAGGYAGGGGLSGLFGGAGGAGSAAALAGQAGGDLFAGNTMGGATTAAGAAPAFGTGVGATADPFAGNTMAAISPTAAAGSPYPGSATPINWQQAIKGGLAAGFGSGIAGQLAPQNTNPTPPIGFTTPLAPLNPQFGQLTGSQQSNRPNFAGYDPVASVTGTGYNFFPQITG